MIYFALTIISGPDLELDMFSSVASSGVHTEGWLSRTAAYTHVPRSALLSWVSRVGAQASQLTPKMDKNELQLGKKFAFKFELNQLSTLFENKIWNGS